MELQTLTHKLVARICTHCRVERIPLGQVRTTKLIYLIECEYTGWTGRRLTDLDWRFWHYGPWSPTLDRVLKDDFHAPAEEESDTGNLVPVHWEPPAFDQPQVRLPDVTAEGILLRVLERFAALPYAELLDHVYFETWPMRDAVKGQDLDFSEIPKPRPFVDPTSKLPPKVFHELRVRFAGLRETSGAAEPDSDRDPELLRLLAAMDEGSELTLPEGEVVIDDAMKARLRGLAED